MTRGGAKPSAHVEGAVLLGDLSSAERENLGPETEGQAEARDPRIDPPWPADHPTGVHVVFRAVHRTDEASVPIEAALPQIAQEVAAASSDGEVFALDVSDGVGSPPSHGSGRKVGRRAEALPAA